MDAHGHDRRHPAPQPGTDDPANVTGTRSPHPRPDERINRSGWLAGSLVFVASLGVLLLEIVATKLVAPYVGITLQTYTGVTGTILAAIAFGAWYGGLLADRHPTTRLLGPFFVAAGLTTLVAPAIVRTAGPHLHLPTNVNVVVLVVTGMVVPTTLLSAIPPMIVKARLAARGPVGATVGSLSAISTFGAVAGTFLTGYVLLATMAIRTIMFTSGAVLVTVGVACANLRPSRDVRLGAVAVLAVVPAGWWATVAPTPCQHETRYACVRVQVDPANPNGRILYLDDVRHSYVNLADRAQLGFSYLRVLHDVVDHMTTGTPSDAVFVGGGGYILPERFTVEHPAATATVLELDPDLLTIAEADLGFPGPSDRLQVRTGDARTTLTAVPAGTADVIVVDVFGGRSVPWQLTTREFVTGAAARLRPGGVYVANLLDTPAGRFVTAEAKTLLTVFRYVTVLAAPHRPGQVTNNVVVAADRPLDGLDTLAAVTADGYTVLDGDRLAAAVAGAEVLTDDYAPVDQYLAEPG